MCNRFLTLVLLSYIQVLCYLPFLQLHADFGDFSNEVCHVTMFTLAVESNPFEGLLKQFAFSRTLWQVQP